MLIKNKLITRFHCGNMSFTNEKMFDFESIVHVLDKIIASDTPICGEYGFIPMWNNNTEFSEKLERCQTIKEPAVCIKNINYRVVCTTDSKFKTVYLYGDVTPLSDDGRTLLASDNYKFEWRGLLRYNHVFRNSIIKLVALDILYK